MALEALDAHLHVPPILPNVADPHHVQAPWAAAFYDVASWMDEEVLVDEGLS